jgi:hypothetical protein
MFIKPVLLTESQYKHTSHTEDMIVYLTMKHFHRKMGFLDLSCSASGQKKKICLENVCRQRKKSKYNN